MPRAAALLLLPRAAAAPTRVAPGGTDDGEVAAAPAARGELDGDLLPDAPLWVAGEPLIHAADAPPPRAPAARCGPCTAGADYACTWGVTVDFGANSTALCCAECAAHASCAVAVWQPDSGKCFLKGGDLAAAPADGVWACRVRPDALTAAPPAPTPPPGHHNGAVTPTAAGSGAELGDGSAGALLLETPDELSPPEETPEPITPEPNTTTPEPVTPEPTNTTNNTNSTPEPIPPVPTPFPWPPITPHPTPAPPPSPPGLWHTAEGIGIIAGASVAAAAALGGGAYVWWRRRSGYHLLPTHDGGRAVQRRRWAEERARAEEFLSDAGLSEFSGKLFERGLDEMGTLSDAKDAELKRAGFSPAHVRQFRRALYAQKEEEGGL